jgi:hypothetical protein
VDEAKQGTPANAWASTKDIAIGGTVALVPPYELKDTEFRESLPFLKGDKEGF